MGVHKDGTMVDSVRFKAYNKLVEKMASESVHKDFGNNIEAFYYPDNLRIGKHTIGAQQGWTRFEMSVYFYSDNENWYFFRDALEGTTGKMLTWTRFNSLFEVQTTKLSKFMLE